MSHVARIASQGAPAFQTRYLQWVLQTSGQARARHASPAETSVAAGRAQTLVVQHRSRTSVRVACDSSLLPAWSDVALTAFLPRSTTVVRTILFTELLPAHSWQQPATHERLRQTA